MIIIPITVDIKIYKVFVREILLNSCSKLYSCSWKSYLFPISKLVGRDRLTICMRVMYLLAGPASTPCGGIYESTWGVITSPGFPQNYRNFGSCTNTIKALPGSTVVLNFTSFDVVACGNCSCASLKVKISILFLSLSINID